MRKRISILLLLLIFVATFHVSSVSAASSDLVFKPNLKISINGVDGIFNYGVPAIENGRSLLPLRDLLINLGVTDDDEHIIWNAKTKTVNIIYNEITLSLSVNSSDILKNGAAFQKLEVPAQLINNRVYLPTRAIAEALGFIVNYVAQTESILVTTSTVTGNKPDVLITEPIKEPAKVVPEVIELDTIPPAVTVALATTAYKLEVLFSEPLDKTTAENIANYSIIEKYGSHSILKVTFAELQADLTKIVLTVSSQSAAVLYSLDLTNIKDSNGNTIVPSSTTFVGIAGGTPEVVIDPNALPVVSVTSLSLTTIEVKFGKYMSKASVESIANIKINEMYGLKTSLTITGAQLQADGITLVISTGSQSAVLYGLYFTGLTDAVGNSVTLDQQTFVGKYDPHS